MRTFIAALLVSASIHAQEPADRTHTHVYTENPGAVDDARARRVRHTDTVFSMGQFGGRAEWEAFAERLRKRLLLSSGLYPLPDRGPLNARVFDRIQQDDYSVEKVHFEAWPGFYVTGNLYRPVGEGPFPAVLMPHGHWEHGRLEDGERGSVPARAITFARMGAIALTIDMVGYNDSCQLEHRWGSPALKLWGLHPFAVQLWSSIRSVDFLETLPDVDVNRIGCTGASGGGTQTFTLMAVDPRIQVAAPVNMISSTMQGGCVCENAPLIRLENSNMEIGAMMAPRPLMLVSATGDWTRETPRVEYPAIRSIYELYGAAHRIDEHQVDAPHNYNLESREAVYRFFGRWLLDRGDWQTFEEPPYIAEAPERVRVFPEDALPPGSLKGDAAIAAILDERRKDRSEMLELARENLPEFQYRFGDIFGLLTGASTPAANELSNERVAREQARGYTLERWILSRAAVGDRVPALLYLPTENAKGDAVLLVHGEGKAAFGEGDQPGLLVRGALTDGKAVLVIDAYLQGEHHAPGATTEQQTIGEFSDTFNPTITSQRVQDILTAAAFLRAQRDLTGPIDLVGLGDAGIWALIASATDRSFRRTVADTNGFDPSDDAAWAERYYIPSIRAIGDVHAACALIAPNALTLFNTQGRFGANSIERYYVGSRMFRHFDDDAGQTGALDALR